MTRTARRSKKVDFYIRPFVESAKLLSVKLPGSVWRMIEYMSACCTWGNEVVFMPPIKEVAEILHMGLSTAYNCLKIIRETFSFIRFQISSQFIVAYRTDPDNPKNFFDSQNQENFRVQKNQFSEYRKHSQKRESQQPEPLPDETSSSPQTYKTVHTPQTGEVGTNSTEEEKTAKSESCSTQDSPNNYTPLPNHAQKTDTSRAETQVKYNVLEEKTETQVKDDVLEEKTAKSESCSTQDSPNNYTPLPNHARKTDTSRAKAQVKHDIPEELAERLRQCNIPISEEVLNKIKSHHISKAYGAITHVENTWETIQNPKAIFLYQLPRQPVEKLGQRYSDELLNKQKKELEQIERERAAGIQPLSANTKFQQMKEKLLLKVKIVKKKEPYSDS